MIRGQVHMNHPDDAVLLLSLSRLSHAYMISVCSFQYTQNKFCWRIKKHFFSKKEQQKEILSPLDPDQQWKTAIHKVNLRQAAKNTEHFPWQLLGAAGLNEHYYTKNSTEHSLSCVIVCIDIIEACLIKLLKGKGTYSWYASSLIILYCFPAMF